MDKSEGGEKMKMILFVGKVSELKRRLKKCKEKTSD